jgi:YidC/Oxa1 family membrane protein insertase
MIKKIFNKKLPLLIILFLFVIASFFCIATAAETPITPSIVFKHPLNVTVRAKGSASEVLPVIIKVDNQGAIITKLSLTITGEKTEGIEPFLRISTKDIKILFPDPVAAGKSAQFQYPLEIPSSVKPGKYNLKINLSFTEIDSSISEYTSVFYVEVKNPNILVGGLRWLLDQISKLFFGYGIGIILFSILIKVVLYPLNITQLKSMSQMQRIQPKINEINKMYKDNPQKKTEETMKLYKDAKINPASGCFPMVIQLVIVYFLYLALQGYTPLFKSSFLWLPSLGERDPFYIFPILAGVSTFLQSMTGGQTQDPQSKTFMYFMPFFFFWIMIRFPSALAIFWTIYGLLSAVQQYFFMKKNANQLPPVKPIKQITKPAE